MIAGKKETGEGEPAKWDKKPNLPEVNTIIRRDKAMDIKYLYIPIGDQLN